MWHSARATESGLPLALDRNRFARRVQWVDCSSETTVVPSVHKSENGGGSQWVALGVAIPDVRWHQLLPAAAAAVLAAAAAAREIYVKVKIF